MLRIRMPDSAIRPRMALKPNGWWKIEQRRNGADQPERCRQRTPSPSPQNERTWKMMTISVRMIMIGKDGDQRRHWP